MLQARRHRSHYCKLLDGLRQTSDWEAWIDFFLEAAESSDLRSSPLTSINPLGRLSGLSFPTASRALDTLMELGIAREITGGRPLAQLAR